MSLTNDLDTERIELVIYALHSVTVHSKNKV